MSHTFWRNLLICRNFLEKSQQVSSCSSTPSAAHHGHGLSDFADLVMLLYFYHFDDVFLSNAWWGIEICVTEVAWRSILQCLILSGIANWWLLLRMQSQCWVVSMNVMMLFGDCSQGFSHQCWWTYDCNAFLKSRPNHRHELWQFFSMFETCKQCKVVFCSGQRRCSGVKPVSSQFTS